MKERLISAFVALLITVPLILLGGVYFNLLVIVLGLLGLRELLKPMENIPNVMKYISYVLFVVFLLYGYTYTGKVYIMNFSLMLISFLILFTSLIIVLRSSLSSTNWFNDKSPFSYLS